MTEAPFLAKVAEAGGVVTSNAAINAEYWHLIVACSTLAADASPGQFYQLLCRAPPSPGTPPFLQRPMRRR